MLAVGYQLPKVVAIAMPPPGADGEAQKKAKFEKDFIIVSEFSEQVGPIPIVSACFIAHECYVAIDRSVSNVAMYYMV